MGVSERAYGEAANVAALTKGHTSGGTYTATTTPTLAQVEQWINQVSSTLNLLLAEQGFAIPVTQADCIETLTLFVQNEVADLCHYANSAGRFFSDKQYTAGPWKAISKEAADFIGDHANGFEAMGATRTRAGLNGLAARTTDDSGAEIEPMFARKQFGNRTTDWDTE
jgi:hypothetical protein